MADTKTPIERIYRQIERAADYYGPRVYGGALTFDPRLSLDEDPNAVLFIPISQATGKGANPKIFAVGILPPTANITGNLLDRTSTVGPPPGTAVSDTSYGPGVIKKPGKGGMPYYTVDGYQLTPASGTSAGSTAPGKPPSANLTEPTTNQYTVEQLWGIFRKAYTEMKGHEPTSQELQFYVAQSLVETSGKVPNNNFGFGGNYTSPEGHGAVFPRKTTEGPPQPRYFNSYDDPVAGAKGYIGTVTKNPNTVTAAQSGDVMGYLLGLAQAGYYVEPVSKYYRPFAGKGGTLSQVSDAMRKNGVKLSGGGSLPSDTPYSCAFHENNKEYQARNKGKGNKVSWTRFNTNSPYDMYCPMNPDGSTTTEGWAGDGSKAKSEASSDIDSTAGTSIDRRTQTLERLMNAQAATIKQTKAKLDAMAALPPLRLLVNPASFTTTSEKIISDGNHGRQGPIVEHWGDGQDKLEGSGRVAGFYAIDTIGDGGGPGLTRTARNVSESWRNLMSLYLIYKSNGALWFDDANLGVETTLSLMGSVYIYYDNTLYIGSFDTFSLNESDDKPFSIDYSFSFTVRSTFLLDNVDEQFINGRQINPLAQPTIPTSTTPVGELVPGADLMRARIAKGEVGALGTVGDALSTMGPPPPPFDEPPAPNVTASPSSAITTPKKGKGSGVGSVGSI